MSDAVFQPDHDGWRPTELAGSPWSAEALHGGAVAALAAREAERVPSDEPMIPVRLTLELLAPPPMDTIHVSADLVRPGRRVQLIEVTVTAAEAVIARGRLVRLREDHLAGLPVPEDRLPPPRDEGEPLGGWRARADGFHNLTMEHRFVRGHIRDVGPATDWMRMRHPLVPGEDPSPFQRVVAAADHGNGVSRILDFDEYVFINPDLTVYLHRLPAGEWVCLEAVTRVQPEGVGMAECAVYDEHGHIGRSVQSLLVTRA